MTLLDRIADRSTRREALELAIAAYALLAPDAIVKRAARSGNHPRGGPLRLSPPTAELLSIIFEAPAMARMAFVGFVVSVSGDPAVERLALEVAAITVADLATLGTPELVVAMLDAHDRESRAHRDATRAA